MYIMTENGLKSIDLTGRHLEAIEGVPPSKAIGEQTRGYAYAVIAFRNK